MCHIKKKQFLEFFPEKFSRKSVFAGKGHTELTLFLNVAYRKKFIRGTDSSKNEVGYYWIIFGGQWHTAKRLFAACHRPQTLYLYKLAHQKEDFWRIVAVFKNATNFLTTPLKTFFGNNFFWARWILKKPPLAARPRTNIYR